jgi:predicted DsbA family dithiol-disulfide isomerase
MIRARARSPARRHGTGRGLARPFPGRGPAGTIAGDVRGRSLTVEPVTLVLYEDPLSPWSWVAERRVEAALASLPGVFAPLRHAAFPLRVEPRTPTASELRSHARAARRAAREPEAAGTRPDLWLSPDPPRSSVPALAALSAARPQGEALEAALRAAIREAAFLRGLNVARTDVLLELAERVGLDLDRFAPALGARRTQAEVCASREEAEDRGVEHAPALVIGDEWLLSGARPLEEYGDVLRRYAAVRAGITAPCTLH